MSEKISVVMPVYNGAKFMKSTIAQIKAQTFTDFKCYLIDDCSGDDSVKIIEKNIKGDDRFVLIKNQKNLGKPETLNKGLSMAQGEYILMLDDDDEYAPTIIEKLYCRAEKDGLDIAVGNMRLYDLQEKEYSDKVLSFNNLFEGKVYSIENIPTDDFFLRKFFSTIWNKLFRREFLVENELRFENYFPADDTLFVFEAILKARKIGIVEDVLITWKVNDKNSGMGSLARNDQYKNIIRVLAKMDDNLRSDTSFNRLMESWVPFPLYSVVGLMQESMRNSDVAKKIYHELKKFYKKMLPKDADNKIKDWDLSLFLKSSSYENYLKMRDAEREKELSRIIAYDEAMIKNLQGELAAVKGSRSYRLGQALTAPTRFFGKR
jgi:glycosyltransferase involved in cell wall biosynthesis